MLWLIWERGENTHSLTYEKSPFRSAFCLRLFFSDQKKTKILIKYGKRLFWHILTQRWSGRCLSSKKKRKINLIFKEYRGGRLRTISKAATRLFQLGSTVGGCWSDWGTGRDVFVSSSTGSKWNIEQCSLVWIANLHFFTYLGNFGLVKWRSKEEGAKTTLGKFMSFFIY